MNNSKENHADSPLSAVKTPNSESVEDHTTKLEKAIVSAFVPWMGTINSSNMALIDASHCLLSVARNQLELFQSIACETSPREEIQVMAGSLVGFSGGLISQIMALEAITDGLCKQIYKLTKERDSALKSLKAGGEV